MFFILNTIVIPLLIGGIIGIGVAIIWDKIESVLLPLGKYEYYKSQLPEKTLLEDAEIPMNAYRIFVKTRFFFYIKHLYKWVPCSSRLKFHYEARLEDFHKKFC